MAIHFLNKVSNLRHRNTFLKHVNDEGFQRVIGSFVRSNGLLFKLSIAISRNGDL